MHSVILALYNTGSCNEEYNLYSPCFSPQYPSSIHRVVMDVKQIIPSYLNSPSTLIYVLCTCILAKLLR